MSITDPTGPTTNLSVASGSGYASLTGTGETTSPGDLTQDGGLYVDVASTALSDAFKVVDSTGKGIGLFSSGSVAIQQDVSGVTVACLSTGVEITNSIGSSGIVINNTNGTGLIDINGGGTPININGGGTATSDITVGDNIDAVGFFGVTPTGRQVSGGTLAGVIAGLVALGLFTS